MSAANGHTTRPATMKAVILKDEYRVAVEEVPLPKIEGEGDVLVKVRLAGLCGQCRDWLSCLCTSLLSRRLRLSGPLASRVVVLMSRATDNQVPICISTEARKVPIVTSPLDTSSLGRSLRLGRGSRSSKLGM